MLKTKQADIGPKSISLKFVLADIIKETVFFKVANKGKTSNRAEIRRTVKDIFLYFIGIITLKKIGEIINNGIGSLEIKLTFSQILGSKPQSNITKSIDTEQANISAKKARVIRVIPFI
tara:strand:- start:4 stop:360 length:357 start_codon:yes stop_codon:yes gene_type:complete